MLAIKQKIHQKIDSLMESDISIEDKFTFYIELIELVTATQFSEEVLLNYFQDEEVAKYISLLRAFVIDWEIYLEKIMNDYIYLGIVPLGVNQSTCEKIKNYYIDQYRKLIYAEIKSGMVNTASRVCHVGIGSMPLSILMLHKYSNKCSIVGIDNNRSVLDLAGQFIEAKCNLEPEYYNKNVINITHAEGALFDYHSFDVVILSTSITNKQAIIEQINCTASCELVVLDRQVKGLSQYIYAGSKFNMQNFIFKYATSVSIITLDTYQLVLK